MNHNFGTPQAQTENGARCCTDNNNDATDAGANAVDPQSLQRSTLRRQESSKHQATATVTTPKTVPERTLRRRECSAADATTAPAAPWSLRHSAASEASVADTNRKLLPLATATVGLAPLIDH